MASRVRKDPPSFELQAVTRCFEGRRSILEDDADLLAQAAAGEECQDPEDPQ